MTTFKKEQQKQKQLTKTSEERISSLKQTIADYESVINSQKLIISEQEIKIQTHREIATSFMELKMILLILITRKNKTQ